tara:strand:- start:1390 stop:2826 length:1437 start_codon:yes stop_codon:yes gene_type:complete
MKKIILLLSSVIFLLSTPIIANEALIGSWEKDDGTRMDIIDGFKPNIGPVIIWENGELSETHTWKVNTNTDELSIYWSSGVFNVSNNGNKLNWERESWTKIDNIEMKNVINLQNDPDAFINQLTGFSWSSSSSQSDKKEFTKTFTSTEGVLSEFDKDNNFTEISSWGIASGALKIGDYKVYLESKISEKFLIALDTDDSFLVLYKGEKKEIFDRISLADSRDKFLASLTTGAWMTNGAYYGKSVYRYRPIEGELKGRVFTEQDSKLISSEVWEYSPSTGAFLQSYTEFTSALNIGDILVFVDTSGNQSSYFRDKSVELKKFSLNDVVNIQVSERSKNEIKELINQQMSVGGGNVFTLFEFNEDNRTGYLHEWNSTPFQVTGQTLTIGDYYQFEQLYRVEDYILFDEQWSKKIDTRESRMKPKTDIEAKEDSVEAIEVLDEISQTSLKIKIELKDGTSKTIPIPVPSLLDLKSITVITQ